MPKPILKSGVRILRPSEYHQLHEGARTLENRTLCDALLLTGLRYVEAQRFQGNMDWLDGRFIHLPAFAQRKVKRQQRERWIKLSSKGMSIILLSQDESPAHMESLERGPEEMGDKFTT